MGGAALAVPGTGASCGLSTVTDQGIDAPGAIDVGADRAVAVTLRLVFPAGSVKLTVTGKGLTTTAAAELLCTTPLTDVCTNGGRLARSDVEGAALSRCWSMWSTVAETPPTGHTAGAGSAPRAADVPVGVWPMVGAVAAPADGEGDPTGDDPVAGVPDGVDEGALPAPTAFCCE